MDATSTFEPKNCPVGVSNEKEIEHLGDRMDMAIERLTEKVSEIKEDVGSLHKSMDKEFAKVDKRFDTMDQKIEAINQSIPQKIEEEIEKKRGSAASSAIRWVFLGVGTSILISVLTAWVKSRLGL